MCSHVFAEHLLFFTLTFLRCFCKLSCKTKTASITGSSGVTSRFQDVYEFQRLLFMETLVILIFLITPTSTWLFAGYPYPSGTKKAAKISNKNSAFNWEHSLHTELMNASHSTNVFTNSCDQISTNGKAPIHSYINLRHSTIPLFALTKG